MAKRSVYSILYPENTFYTKGFEYSLDGENYIGEYHVVDGQAYTGPPKIGANYRKPLTKYYDNASVYAYDKLKNFNKVESTYRTPIYIRPEPTTADYKSGYTTRYLLQYTLDRSQVPIEIGSAGNSLYGKKKGYDAGLYDLIILKWQISGPLYDYKTMMSGQKQIVNGEEVLLRPREHVIPGIIDANKRAVGAYSDRYPSLPYAFKNYQEFAQPTVL